MDNTEIKDELIFIANSKIKETGLSYRNLARVIASANLVLLGRLSNYKTEQVKIEKIMDIINELDHFISGKVFGFSLTIKNNTLSLTYNNAQPS